MPAKPLQFKVTLNHVVFLDETGAINFRAKCGYKNAMKIQIKNYSKYEQIVSVRETKEIRSDIHDYKIAPFSDAIAKIYFTIPIGYVRNFLYVDFL